MQAYSNPKRADDAHSLPDVEIFQEDAITCEHCGATFPDPNDNPILCPDCGKKTRAACSDRQVWWWWACFPGCLPDGDPQGPFDSENAALADAHSAAWDDDDDEDA